MKDEVRKVIDADNMVCLEVFYKSELEEKLNYYKSVGKWGDVGVDLDGDIILYIDEPIKETEW